jgi:hypothetical protein
MSYDIVKSIVIKDGKVFARAACNNVSPRHYEPWESACFTKILQEQGEEALDVEILKDYENGNFRPYPGTSNKYTRALDALRAMPDYALFSWHTSGEEYNLACERRKSEAFTDLLKKALRHKEPRGRFVIQNPYSSMYLRKRGPKTARWVDKEVATVFTSRTDAEKYKARFGGSEWSVVSLPRLGPYAKLYAAA